MIEKAKEMKLIEGVKKHNQKFHSEGRTKVDAVKIIANSNNNFFIFLNIYLLVVKHTTLKLKLQY